MGEISVVKNLRNNLNQFDILIWVWYCNKEIKDVLQSKLGGGMAQDILKNNIPVHVAAIMDGNGRWAKARGLIRSLGHRAGVKTLEQITESLFDEGVKYFTVYAFSSENTQRPASEVKALMALIKEFFKKRLSKFIKNQMRVCVIGDKSYFSDSIKQLIIETEEKTAHFIDKTFVLALNYGARDELLRAVNKAVDLGKTVTEKEFGTLLDTQDIPDPDIIIRTGGETRLSNFLLYQAAYSELFFVPDLWPDFTPERLKEILNAYATRNRTYGRVHT